MAVLNRPGCAARSVAGKRQSILDRKVERSNPPLPEEPPPSDSIVARLAARFGINRAVGFSVLVRSWSVVAGPVTLVFVGHFLSREEQGFYYTFWSVLGLQIVFELGFSFIIAQFASHERASLRRLDGRMTGDARARERLASLLRLSVRWYCAAGLFMIGVLLPAGLFFFARYSRAAVVNWVLPWILVTFMTSLNLTLVPFAAILEGAGQVEDVAVMRLLQLIVANILVWISLAAGLHLYSAVVLSGAMAVFSACWIVKRHWAMFADLWSAGVDGHRVHWRTEVWPFQWRMAVSWISGYLIFQLFNPILFAAQGAVAAAQMGMSLMVVMAISTFGMAWINARAVDYGSLIALRRFVELDGIFRATLWQSTAAMTVISSGFFGAVIFLRAVRHPFADRLLSPLPLLLLIAGTIANHVLVAEAAYLRAYKREPFMALTLMMATLAIGGSLLVARSQGAIGVSAMFLCAVVIGLAGGTTIFLRARRRWSAMAGPSFELMLTGLSDSRDVGGF